MEACLIAANVAMFNASGAMVGQWEGGRVDIDFIGAADGDSRFHANIRVCGDLEQWQLDELPILDPAPSTPMRVFA